MAEDSQPQVTRDARARRRRGVIALMRSRLKRSGGGRIAAVLRVFVVVGFAGAILLLRASDGGEAPLAGLVSAAARWIAWLTGAPLALAIAGDHLSRDRRDGIDALASARGFSSQSLASARLFGAMLEASSAIGVPLVALALLTAALAGNLRLALGRLGLALAAAAFAVVAGVTLGGVASACGQIGRARGRWLLLVVVTGPWILADLAGYSAFSIPGALAAVLDFTLGSAGS